MSSTHQCKRWCYNERVADTENENELLLYITLKYKFNIMYNNAS